MVSVFLGQESFVQGILTFLIVGLFAVTLLVVVRFLPAAHAVSGVSASMLSPLGALFGLTAAFLGASVWQSHSEGVAAANTEAHALSAAWIIAEKLPDPRRTDVRRDIADYIAVVTTEEWPILASVSSLENPVSKRARQHMFDAIRSLLTDTRAEVPALASTAHELRIAFEARSRRMDVALRRISTVQLGSTLALGLLLITLVAFVHNNSRPSQIVGVAMASLAVAIAITAIVTHDNPFSGYLAFTAEDFAYLARYGTTAGEDGVP